MRLLKGGPNTFQAIQVTHFKCTYTTFVNLPRADDCLTWKLVFSKSLVLEDGAKQCMTWRWLVFPSSRVSRALSFILVSDCLYLRFKYTSLLKVFGCNGTSQQRDMAMVGIAIFSGETRVCGFENRLDRSALVGNSPPTILAFAPSFSHSKQIFDYETMLPGFDPQLVIKKVLVLREAFKNYSTDFFR